MVEKSVQTVEQVEVGVQTAKFGDVTNDKEETLEPFGSPTNDSLAIFSPKKNNFTLKKARKKSLSLEENGINIETDEESGLTGGLKPHKKLPPMRSKSRGLDTNAYKKSHFSKHGHQRSLGGG